MNISIRVLSTTDVQELTDLITLFKQVFDMQPFVTPNHEHLEQLLQKNNFIAVIAEIDNHIIGGLTVYLLDQYYSTKPLAYLYDLAVLPSYQRQGIGKKLINFINLYCAQQGIEEVFVQADKVDDYAIDFYRSTKPTNEEEVVHFSYRLPPDIAP
ncbi:GNAT family N-acetyltransferase [Olivibacter sp. SDN3]|uniref:GNAT family N-acetyltransferase n=1 Tax=Olivibacter sp. SDN3 TaxID=2764720 RepID=UPI001651AD4C|nr:GNAT family N-acetyltransferase [Olivibacter sp. SDN3]QNL51016.1 GNAT family N-acetyltransferase [Olivibacter sp. SDN3]